MRIYSIAILRYMRDTPDPLCLTQATELGDFNVFQRPTVKEMLGFFSKTFAKKTMPGQRNTIQHEGYNIHIYHRTDGLIGVVTADGEYPPRVAYTLVGKILDEFAAACPRWDSITQAEGASFDVLPSHLARYQDPSSADAFMRVQRNLDETKDILHQTIDQVLDRGEKLEDLVERSGELSAQSKLFYKQARRTNSCCVIS